MLGGGNGRGGKDGIEMGSEGHFIGKDGHLIGSEGTRMGLLGMRMRLLGSLGAANTPVTFMGKLLHMSDSTIKPETRTTLYILATCCATAVGCTWWLRGAFMSIDARLATLERSVQDIRDSQSKPSQMVEFAQRLAFQNPGLKVPDPVKMSESFMFNKEPK